VGGIGPETAGLGRDITPVMPRSDAITQETPAPAGANAPVAPAATAGPRVAVLLEGTPVPPEATEALLTGLLKGENESYFHKAKPASESSGEAAVAYAAGPHVVSRSNPTPPPQPAVMLRRSLELDIAGGPATPPPPAVASPPEPPPPPTPPTPTVPPSADRDRLRATAPTEQTMPLVVPLKGKWVDRWLAFVLAAALAGLVCMGMVHWLSPVVDAPAPSVAPPPRPTVTSPSVSRPRVLPPSATTAGAATASAGPVAPATSAAPIADPTTDEQGSARPPRASTSSAPPAASALPAPKSDVKRAM
jgi:hypothetical protein